MSERCSGGKINVSGILQVLRAGHFSRRAVFKHLELTFSLVVRRQEAVATYSCIRTARSLYFRVLKTLESGDRV